MQRRKLCQRREVIPPVETEVMGLLDAAPHATMATFAAVAAFSGLRLFEVAALELGDVDLDRGRLVVRRGKGRGPGDVPEDSLLFEPGLSALGIFLERGFAYERGPMFRTGLGTRYSRQHVSRLWAPMRRTAGVDCTFHALRHFHACWLLDRGASITDVAKQLRHRDNGQLVQRVYGRWLSRKAALDRLEALR